MLETYDMGKAEFGKRAYQPLMLLKAILLQKWFGIDSDPELENQINDRLSFKVFMRLPLALPFPDHSIICRFRERMGKETLEKIHHELLQQFKSKGFSIESGMAVDARLVRSASCPLSNKKPDELREEGKEQSKAVRFQRDLESDWTVKDGEAIFGLKAHASIDVESGLVLSTLISRASEHDTSYFQAVVLKSIHGEALPWKVSADKGHCSEANRQFLSMNGIQDGRLCGRIRSTPS